MTNKYPYMIRRVDESNRTFYKRAFDYAMSQVDRHYRLQTMRTTEGHFGAAIFYQTQAARWYERAMECHDDYSALLETLIPLTDVRWDEVFKMRGKQIHDDVMAMLQNFSSEKLDHYISERIQLRNVIPEDQLNTMRIRARKIVADPRWKARHDARPRETHYITPKQKYDNPRDVPLTLEQLSDQLKRWIS